MIASSALVRSPPVSSSQRIAAEPPVQAPNSSSSASATAVAAMNDAMTERSGPRAAGFIVASAKPSAIRISAVSTPMSL